MFDFSFKFRCTLTVGQQFCGKNTNCNNTIGSFNCDLTSCKDGFANWRQTEGEPFCFIFKVDFEKDTYFDIKHCSGCWKILDGNIWETATEQEYAVNEGKVI